MQALYNYFALYGHGRGGKIPNRLCHSPHAKPFKDKIRLYDLHLKRCERKNKEQPNNIADYLFIDFIFFSESKVFSVTFKQKLF